MAFRFESLDIWHMARAYARKVYAVTTKFPRHEDYGLRSQMKRKAIYDDGERLAKAINAFRNTVHP